MGRFEIQSLNHKPNEISFNWEDVGGMYRVYKDRRHVYEGTAAEFTDGEVESSKPFQYTIERWENGEVQEVIAIQTSALRPVLEDEHPLLRLVITAIVAPTQIVISWEHIADVEAYDIYRNGTYIDTVEQNWFIDRGQSLTEPAVYSVSATRPLIDANQQLNVSKSAVAKLYDLVMPPKAAGKPTEEQYTFTISIPNPAELIKPVNRRSTSLDIQKWQFRYSTFLKEDVIKNPNLLSLLPYFTGDDRGFDPDGKSFRTRVELEADFNKESNPLSFSKAVGPTVALNYFKRYQKHGHASVDGIGIGRLKGEPGEIVFQIDHEVGNPLTPAPAIHYEVLGIIGKNGQMDLSGYHNAAPHHEIYLRLNDEEEWQTVYQAESEGLAYLSGALADRYWRYLSFA